MRTPARPANIEPIDQLIVAITVGECPKDAAAISCSATAVVIRPKEV